MKKENAILLGVGAALAGFLGFRYYKRKNAAKALPEESQKEFEVVFIQPTGGVTAQPAGFSPYQKTVMEIQAILGVAIDGDPGRSAASQTNMALKKKAPATFSKYGIITSANAKSYLILLKGPANLIF